MIVLDFIVLSIAFFSTLLFIINIIADLSISSSTFIVEDDNKQRQLNAKYRLVLASIMSVAWPYVILFL